MGVYVYKITRKSKEIDGQRVYRSEYVYKPFSGWDGDEINERIERKHIAPTQRAWERHGGCRDVLYTTGFEHGARIYRNPSSSCSHYDTPDHPGEVVGTIKSIGGYLTIGASQYGNAGVAS